MKKPKTLRAVHGSPGIRAAYRRKLEGMIRQMHEDAARAVLEEFDAAAWRMARDGAAWRSPSERLAERMERIRKSWERRFKTFAESAAGLFVRQIWARVRLGRKNELASLGLGVTINPSRFTSDTYQALLRENVSLIKNIPKNYCERIEADVQRAVLAGGDRTGLMRALRTGYGFSQKRARLIARDQTAKATQALAESTDRDLGFTEGIWVHVPGRKSSRPTHIAMNGKKFELGKGLYDKDAGGRGRGAYVVPGRLVNCMCSYRPVIPENWRA